MSLWTSPRRCSLADRRGQTDARGAGTAPPPWAAEQPLQQLAARVLEHQHGPAAFADKLAAAAPPTHRPTHPSIRIRGPGDRGWRATGAPTAGTTASTATRWPSARRRHPRQKTRSPSSHKTWRLPSSSPPNGKNRSNCRTPSASRLSPSVKQAWRICARKPSAACVDTMPGPRPRDDGFSRHQATVGPTSAVVDGRRWQSHERTSAYRR